MRKFNNPTLFFIVTICLFISGCTAKSEPSAVANTIADVTSISPTNDLTNEDPDTAIIIPTPPLQITSFATSTLFPVPLSTPTYPIATSPAGSSTPTSENLERGTYICNSPPTIINIQEIFDFNSFANIYFVNEHRLRVEGWVSREYIPTTPISTAPPWEQEGESGIRSADIFWRTGEFDLESGEREIIEPTFLPLLQNPCPENCSLDIISQSPDEQWQLVQAPLGSGALGFWLVSQGAMVQLVEYVPTFSKWTWSTDSSILWFIHTEPVNGARVLFVSLAETTPTIIEAESHALSPFALTHNYLAFSPTEKRVLSLAILPHAEPIPELYSFEFRQNTIEETEVEQIPNLIKIEWDEGTQNILNIYRNEDIMRITPYDNSMNLSLSLDLFELPTEIMDRNIPLNIHAVSPSFQQLATAFGSGRVFVFSCGE